MEKIDRTVIEALLWQIKRPGIDDLIDYLQGGTDFYSAPASTRFHGAEPGGLVRHSMEVYRQLNDIMQMYQDVLDNPIDHDTTLICGLLHDVCKANFYKAGTRNVKNEQTGQWEKVPCYTIDDEMPLGHGEKSVIILQQFISLKKEEVLAIRWHMGGFDDAARSYAGGMSMGKAADDCKLVTLLQMADMAASRLMEV